MLERTMTTQLMLTLIALVIWLLYIGSSRFAGQRFAHQPFAHRRETRRQINRLFYGLLTIYALGHILFVGYAWLNRLTFPLNLETMELLKLQHVRRLLAGLPLYVTPSADFIPLVYNPLYYYLVLPFTWIGGVTLPALRGASIVGAIGSYLIVFLAVRQSVASLRDKSSAPQRAQRQGPRQRTAAMLTKSPTWWGLMAVGLMAASFRVMDTYLDNASADSWTLLTILLGAYLISLNRSRFVNLLGILFLITAFWLKQYGAIFTMGAVGYLTWREGWRSWPYWLIALLLGPILFFGAPPQWFGTEFHYYTWEVPRQWAYFSLNSTVLRVIKYLIKHFGWLLFSSGMLWLWLLWRNVHALTIWMFLLPFALLSGPYVALDPGNNNNVFIPLATWLIITGVVAIHFFVVHLSAAQRWGAPLFLLGASFALVAYQPATVLIPRAANATYRDLITLVDELDGVVYAPGIGQLQERELFYPTAHWVTLIDLIRKPGADLCDQPFARELLEPVLHPEGPAYILLEHPLEEDAMLSFLAASYVLDRDFGNRFVALRDSPKLLEVGWPTYLYRYDPTKGNDGAWQCQ